MNVLYLSQYPCGECMITLSLPRSGACNLAILNCAPVFAPRLLRCACGLVMQYCNVFFKCSLPALGSIWSVTLLCLFRVSLLACSAPWLSGVLSELKPGFLQIVFSRIRGRVHDNRYEENYQQQHQNAFLQPRWQAFYTIQNKCKPHQLGQNTGVGQR